MLVSGALGFGLGLGLELDFEVAKGRSRKRVLCMEGIIWVICLVKMVTNLY